MHQGRHRAALSVTGRYPQRYGGVGVCSEGVGGVAALADTPDLSCGRRLASRHLNHRTYHTNSGARLAARVDAVRVSTDAQPILDGYRRRP
jgi:hypothetical protein